MREVIASGKTVEEATENGCRELGLGRDEVSVEILEFPVKKLFKTVPAKVRVVADAADGADADVAPSAAATAQAKAPLPEKKPQAAPVREAAQVKTGAGRPQAASAAQAAPEAVSVQVQPAAGPVRQKVEGKVLPAEPEEAIDVSASPRVQLAVEYLTGIFSAMGVPAIQIEAFKQGDATLLRVEGDAIADKVEVRGEVIQALSYLIDRSVNAGVDKKEDDYLRVRLDVAGYRNRRESELIALAKRTGQEVARTGRSRTLAPMNPYERLIVHTTISSMEGITSESIGADTERRVVVKSLAPDATDGEDWRPTGGSGYGHGRDNRRGGRPTGERGGERGGFGGRDGGRGGVMPRSSTPEREYADAPRDPDAQPVVPKRREAIKDGDDLPLYGKIEL